MESGEANKPSGRLSEHPVEKRASLPSAGMRGRPVADAGPGESPCPAGRDDAVSEARANTASLDLHVPRLGEEPKKEGPHGAGLLPGVPRADYQILTRWSHRRTTAQPALQPNATENTSIIDGPPPAPNHP